MITPEPPAGSEHYREGWRHGYEQAAIDRERSADAVRLVPDPGQAREPVQPAASGPPQPCRESEGMTGIDCEVGDKGHPLPHRGWWCHEDDMGGEYAVYIEWPVPDRPDITAVGRGSGDTVQAPDVDWLARFCAAAEAADNQGWAGTAVNLYDLASQLSPNDEDDSDAVIEAIGRALLGTDTTPDRLAWISEAGETAAAERQARYQETACARRPAEERPDA